MVLDWSLGATCLADNPMRMRFPLPLLHLLARSCWSMDGPGMVLGLTPATANVARSSQRSVRLSSVHRRTILSARGQRC